jgi:carbamoyl-phosphate synthase small subunit
MRKEAHLVLEDGTVYQGEAFGAEAPAYGEVVFTTAMTGYQEMLTDPSYAGQIVVPTYPLIGNYGVNSDDFESARVQVAAFVVRWQCEAPSHTHGERTLHEFLSTQGIPGLSGIDTRAVTRRLRLGGVMMGAVAVGITPQEALARLREATGYGDTDFVRQVSTDRPYCWEGAPHTALSVAPSAGRETSKSRIIVTDYGLKHNILRLLRARGCEVIVVPADTSADEVLALQPDGVLLSPGPGNPALLNYAVEVTRGLLGHLPIMGICLGHQVMARAFGGKTYKLKFGHRGANHPVRDVATGRVYITAQNHGYAVDADSLPQADLQVSHISLNDGTVEGLTGRSEPVLTIQYHSEASPGPHDNEYLFDRFLELVREAKG